MRITRQSIVKDAVESSKRAPEIFAKHGMNPLERCVGMYDLNTIEDAEDWCGLHDLDGLVEELNQAIEQEEVADGHTGIRNGEHADEGTGDVAERAAARRSAGQPEPVVTGCSHGEPKRAHCGHVKETMAAGR